MTDDLKAPERTFDHPYELSRSDGEWWTLKSNGFVVASFSLKTWGSAERIIEAAWQYAYGQPDANRITTLEAALADMTQQRDTYHEAAKRHRDEVQRLLLDVIPSLEKQRDTAMAGAVKGAVKELAAALWLESEGEAVEGLYEARHYDSAIADYEAKAARILAALTPDPDRMLALTAAAYKDAAEVIEDNMRHAKELGREIWPIPDLRTRTHADALAALSRIEAQAEARGMRICADIYYTRCCADDDGDDVYREMMSSADATEAAAKGGV